MVDSKWYDSSKDDDIMKEKLKIQQTNTKYDGLIIDWGEEANSEIDERLSVALDTIPVNDVAVSKILKNAAMLFIRSQYRETLNNEKGAQRDWKRFLDKIDAAVTKAKSNPLENTRAKPTLHSKNIRSYPISPSATGIFLGY